MSFGHFSWSSLTIFPLLTEILHTLLLFMTRTVSLLLPYLSCKTAVRSLTSHLPGVEIERIVLHCAVPHGHQVVVVMWQIMVVIMMVMIVLVILVVVTMTVFTIMEWWWCWWQCNGAKFPISHTSSFRVLRITIITIHPTYCWNIVIVQLDLVVRDDVAHDRLGHVGVFDSNSMTNFMQCYCPQIRSTCCGGHPIFFFIKMYFTREAIAWLWVVCVSESSSGAISKMTWRIAKKLSSKLIVTSKIDTVSIPVLLPSKFTTILPYLM